MLSKIELKIEQCEAYLVGGKLSFWKLQGVKEMQKRVIRMFQIMGSDRTDSRDCWALLDHKIPIVGLGLRDTKRQNSNQQ